MVSSPLIKSPYVEVCEEQENYLLIKLSGELGGKSFRESELNRLLDDLAQVKRNIICDLSQFSYLNQNMVSFLVGVQSQLDENGYRMVLYKLKNRLKTLFLFLKLNDFLIHASNLEDAKKYLSKVKP